MKGKDSTVEFSDKEAVATFSKEYHDRLESLGLDGHMVLLEAWSPFFIDVHECTPDHMAMPKMDFAMGDPGGVSALALSRVGKNQFIDWLSGLSEELDRVGVHHHDIHPGNIMYSQQHGFKLIDFAWASRGQVDTGSLVNGKGWPLNAQYGADDQVAIDTLILDLREFDDVRRLLDGIGQKYLDGSSTKRGRPYHRIPFPEFDDIQPCCPDKSTRKCYKHLQIDMAKKCNPYPSVVDLGCASGYFSFRISKFARQVVAIDSDPNVSALNQRLGDYKRIDNVRFRLGNVEDVDVWQGDVCLLLNLHHWVWKQGGKAACARLLRGINASRLYFMTADKGSVAKFTVPMTTKRVEAHLQSCGWEPRQIHFDKQRRRTLFACTRI